MSRGADSGERTPALLTSLLSEVAELLIVLKRKGVMNKGHAVGDVVLEKMRSIDMCSSYSRGPFVQGNGPIYDSRRPLPVGARTPGSPSWTERR